MQSYSQCSQDIILDREVFKSHQGGVFCEVGAFDGVQLSNSLFFEKNRSWTGMCIEAQPEMYRKLCENRPNCINVMGCAFNQDKPVQFRVCQGYTSMLSGIESAYDPRHVERIESEQAAYGGSSQVTTVPGFRLSTLFDRHEIKTVDYLSIDTEGSELEVLQGIDFSKVKINTIEIEENYPDQAGPIYQLLKDNGFEVLMNITWDTIFINKNAQFSWAK